MKNLVAALGGDAGREALRRFQARGKIASIGPITSATVRDFGLRVDAEADPHTIEGLVEAIAHVGA